MLCQLSYTRVSPGDGIRTRNNPLTRRRTPHLRTGHGLCRDSSRDQVGDRAATRRWVPAISCWPISGLAPWREVPVHLRTGRCDSVVNPSRDRVGGGVLIIPQMKEPPASAPGRAQALGSRYRIAASRCHQFGTPLWCCQAVSATIVDMNVVRRTLFVSVNLTPDARDELRRATLELTTPVGRRLSMSDVLIGVIRVAMRHRDEVVPELASEQP